MNLFHFILITIFTCFQQNEHLISGANEVYRSAWFAYESMSFLLNRDKPAKTLSTVSSCVIHFIYK
jgi:hypothetical protein